MLEVLGSLGWHGMDETNPIPILERRRSEKRKMETELTGSRGTRGTRGVERKERLLRHPISNWYMDMDITTSVLQILLSVISVLWDL